MQPVIAEPSLSTTAESCNICYEDLVETNPSESTIKVLDGCNHKFHRTCIEKWFKTQEDQFQDGSCPLCRHVVVPLSDEKKAQRDENQEAFEHLLNIVMHMSQIPAISRILGEDGGPTAPNLGLPGQQRMVYIPLSLLLPNLPVAEEDDDSSDEDDDDDADFMASLSSLLNQQDDTPAAPDSGRKRANENGEEPESKRRGSGDQQQ